MISVVWPFAVKGYKKKIEPIYLRTNYQGLQIKEKFFLSQFTLLTELLKFCFGQLQTKKV